MQAHKLLGAIDIIGNPIGLIDKLGSGVFEFFNEPRKGLMKGPKEFAKGIGKGFKSLITGVVTGSLDSVSRVSGSLYSIVKNVGGEKVDENALRKPDNALIGVLQGFKGGALDIAKGFTGIFTKPFKGAKEEGAKGFFKGLGTGILGAITSPVSAVLRVGTSVTQGVSATVNKLGKGGLSQHGRIRFPRYITPIGAIIPYDHSLSEAQLIITTLDSKRYAAENILLFESLPENAKDKLKDAPLILMTEKHILLFKNSKSIKLKISFNKLSSVKLYSHEKSHGYAIEFTEKMGAKSIIKSIDYPTLSKCYQLMPQNLREKGEAKH